MLRNGLLTVPVSYSTGRFPGVRKFFWSTCPGAGCGSSRRRAGMKTPPGRPTAVVRSGSLTLKPAECGSWQAQTPLGFRRGPAGLGGPPLFLTHDCGVMMRAPSLLMLLAAAAFTGACGGKSAPEEPAPEPTPVDQPLPAPAPADDNADRERMERERQAREASERSRAVAADLAAMINFDYDQATVRPANPGSQGAGSYRQSERQAPDQWSCRRARVRRVQPGAGQPPRGRGQAVSREQGRGRCAARRHLLR